MSIMQGNQGQLGKQVGQALTAGFGEFSDVLVTELQARFYELNYRGALFSAGLSAATSINAATFTTATLGATQTPILGLWNPLNNLNNVVILQASLTVVQTALQATGGGPFVWAVSTQNGAITTGSAPFNRRTLTQAGSLVKNMSGVALTGLTNNTVLVEGAGLSSGQSYNIASLATAAGFMTPLPAADVQNVDGSFMIPPGGILSLLATTTPVAQSAAGYLLWAEVAL